MSAPSALLAQELASGPATAGTQENAPSATDFGQHILLGATPAADWWRLFQSQPLDEVIRRATSNSHTLAAARSTLLEAQELVRAESGARYPQVSADAGAGRQKYGAQFAGPFYVPPFTYLAVGATVSYTLDYTGKIARSVEQRQALVQYQESEADAAYLALTGNVAEQVIGRPAAHGAGELPAEVHRVLEPQVQPGAPDGGVHVCRVSEQ